MLFFLHKLALRLKRFKPLCLVMVGIGLLGVLMSLLASAPVWTKALQPSIIITLWGMLLFAFIQLFQKIPPPVLPHDSFLTRTAARLRLMAYTLLAFLVVLISVLLLWTSVRLVTV